MAADRFAILYDYRSRLSIGMSDRSTNDATDDQGSDPVVSTVSVMVVMMDPSSG